MRALVLGRVMFILIRLLFIRGRVLGTTQEVFFEVFDVGTSFLEVFDVGKLFLEDINSLIDGANVGTEMLDVVLVLMVVSNQGIEFLVLCGSHFGKGAGKQYRGNKRGLEGWVGPVIRLIDKGGHKQISLDPTGN
jgi:hypothetical protein